MSSRSQVIIAISKKVEIPEDVLKGMEDAEETHENETARYWYWEYVKWNSIDPDVQKVEKLFKQLDEKSKESDDLYGFIEIGDYGIEERGNPFLYDIGYVCNITKAW